MYYNYCLECIIIYTNVCVYSKNISFYSYRFFYIYIYIYTRARVNLNNSFYTYIEKIGTIKMICFGIPYK
jgi:hypothetical protein